MAITDIKSDIPLKIRPKIDFKQASILQFNESGTPIEITEQFLQEFIPVDGEFNAIFGKIGQGKTTLACAMAKKFLDSGQIVYTSFPLRYKGYDQRNNPFYLLLGVLGIKRRFISFPATNYRHLNCLVTDFEWRFDDGRVIQCKDIWDLLPHLTDCIIFFDDVIVQLFDSYEKTFFQKKKREWAFFTRHYDRSIYLVSQRTSQIQVALRSQVNRFYHCEKLLKWPIILFRRTEYQSMKNEDVDLESEPDSMDLVLGTKSVFEMFDSKYLRNGMKASQKLQVGGFKLTSKHSLLLLVKLFRNFFSKFKLRKKVSE